MSASRGSWSLAARLAHREVRRRPLRAVLVVLLVAAPVFVISVAGVLIETQQTHTASDAFRREYGSADLVYIHGGDGPPTFLPSLPAGSRVTDFRSAELPLTPTDGRGLRVVRVNNARGRIGLGAAALQLTSGRAPGAGEMVVSSNVADWLRTGVGARVVFERPRFSARISGIVRSTGDFRTPVLDAPDFPFAMIVQPGLVQTHVAVDLPAGYSIEYRGVRDDGSSGSLAQVALAPGGSPVVIPNSDPGRTGGLVFHTPQGTRPFPAIVETGPAGAGFSSSTVVPDQFGTRRIGPQAKFWSWVAVALVLAMVSVLIAAAFATTARRQLVTLGQLAANGSDQRFLRRMLTLQGTMLGAVGAALGLGAAFGGLSIWHGWIETLYRHQVDYVLSWDLAIIGVTAIGAATIAARFPARTTSRVPVLAALAGRRPLPPVPRLQWLKAMIIFGTGVGLLALVATNASRRDGAQIAAAVAIVGGLFVVAGTAYLTPVVVTVLARAFSRVGASARLAARSLVRVRSRSAAVVTAVAIAGTFATALITAFLGFGVSRDLPSMNTLPANVVFLGDNGARNSFPGSGIGSLAQPAAFDAKQREVAQILPGVRFTPIQGFVAVPVIDQSGSALDVRNRTDGVEESVPIAIDSSRVRSLLRLSPQDISVLERRGLVRTSATEESRAAMVVRVGEGRPFDLPEDRSSNLLHADVLFQAVMTTGRARELGISPTILAFAGTTPRPITKDQRDALYSGVADPYAAPAAAPAFNDGAIEVSVGYDLGALAFWRGFWNPARLQAWFAGGALLFVLVVVAIGLLLGGSEGRDERDVLEQLGVRPRTGRRIGAIKAGFLAFAGAVLAVPSGFIPIAVIFRSVQKSILIDDITVTGSQLGSHAVAYPRIEFPWITAVGILIAIPLIAALGAWIASAVGQRADAFRGPLAFDSD